MQTSNWNVRGLVFTALFAALFIVFSILKISLGFTPVPFTLQSFAIMLAGGLLGARYGFYSILIVVVLTALGLPLLHGEGGISYVLGKTGGFILMFSISALFIGFFAQRIRGKGIIAYIQLLIVMYVFGSLLVYTSGVPWFAHTANMTYSKALTLVCYPFLLPDLFKAILASGIVLTVREYVPNLASKSTK
ncbi:biotin transporter BioY [Paenibacillus psychroresistens]|uniref:Biotin transporter n=1 Tax=Paenibacillus psychroresistens TaxID=1778678 RepID=A0A6B8RN63_9BACL|nr:biotin transporter BioY [Paenibacillus psychroresistens]QGQ97204.1 biotin transporter BioY [Paenibacillus psychroresistens]